MTAPSPRSLLRSGRVYANVADHFLRSRYAQWDTPMPGMGRTIRRVSEARFEEVFAGHESSAVFIHAGLGAVKRAFDRNPYAYLRDVLSEHFESVLAPGFTPSFRESGVYHEKFSRPEYGAFARQFLADAEYRTDDAIHSILVDGAYRFEDCDHQDSFGPNGCWAQLDADDVLICNVGTPWLVTTQHHYIEHVCDVPYNRAVDHDGVIYYDETEYEHTTQRNYTYDLPAKRTARRITRDLRSDDAIECHDLDGLLVRFIRARELREALTPRIEADPYYLIA